MTVIPIRHGYDMWSKQYDHTKNFLVEFDISQQAFREKLISKYVENRRSALDIGCGTGRHLPYLETQFDNVIGLDISPGMLTQARLKIMKPSTQLIESDFLSARLDGMFDLIHCSLALMHFANTHAFFSKISKLLSSEGTMYLVDAPEGMLRSGSSPNFESDGINYCVNYYIHGRQDLTRALMRVGLNLLHFSQSTFPAPCQTVLPKYERYRDRACLFHLVAQRSTK